MSNLDCGLLQASRERTVDAGSLACRATDGPGENGEIMPEAQVSAAVGRAREIYDLCARRDADLTFGLFSDPAWNMRLHLFVSAGQGRRLSVSAACIGAKASAATGLRYLGLLVDAGLVTRVADVNDGRRAFVELTEKGWSYMLRLFADRPRR